MIDAGRERRRPRISLNKLGEYMTASPTRRRSIIADQKKPRPFIVARYTAAERAITEYVANGFDPGVLERHMDDLRRHEATSEYDAERVELCLAALEAIADFDPAVFDDADVGAFGNSDTPHMTINGVDVSVRPEFVVRSSARTGPDQPIGVAKLHFAKNGALTESAGLYVASMLHAFSEEQLVAQGRPSPRHAIVIDVFAARAFVAPRAHARRRADIAAACEEIALRWEVA